MSETFLRISLNGFGQSNILTSAFCRNKQNFRNKQNLSCVKIDPYPRSITWTPINAPKHSYEVICRYDDSKIIDLQLLLQLSLLLLLLLLL